MTDDSEGVTKFRAFFHQATGTANPYPYQERLALGPNLPKLLSIPTGLGKTIAVILAWLWRRRFAGKRIRDATPRRLVYCLPMRVLVEQTVDNAKLWLKNLGLLAEFPGDPKVANTSAWKHWSTSNDADTARIAVSLLMGGEKSDSWDRFPELDALQIGTQDTLLSRALNRGYGMSPYRWPMHFALLHNDSLWLMDETQLMGVGLTTTAQLQGLRDKLTTYGATHSLWMSATLDSKPICTVDHLQPCDGFAGLSLSDEDRQHAPVEKRLGATKLLERSSLVLTSDSERKNYCKELAAEIHAAHRPGTLTLVVLNRVSRAQGVFTELQKSGKPKGQPAELALIHARFRPQDRRQQEERLLSKTLPDAGMVVVATQAIEAGVDVSSANLFTELAPWPSLVQRFGRCNRGGEFPDARIVWIDVQPNDEKDKVSLPYDSKELDRSRGYLTGLDEAGPRSLAPWQKIYADESEPPTVHTLRRKDLLDLWDTTPDLAGNDLDVSRFIRDSDDVDVQFFWRDFAEGQPSESFPAPERHELCSVVVWRAREFLGKLKKKKQFALVWNPLDEIWQSVDPDEVRPGVVLLLKPAMGGYLDSTGWTGDSSDTPSPTLSQPTDNGLERMPDDDLGSRPVALTQHLDDVARAAIDLRRTMSLAASDCIPWNALSRAASWHDVGKAHPAFQTAMRDSTQLRDSDPAALWAKSGGRGRPNYRMPDGTKRKGFRHELASALAWIEHCSACDHANLVAFLIAAHHGKVRASIRSLPNETPPPDENRKFARGIWDKDNLSSVQLPQLETDSEIEMPPTTLDLGLMELGDGKFGPSWLARVLALRNEFGPFRLSFLETLLRVADWRGTEVGEHRDA